MTGNVVEVDDHYISTDARELRAYLESISTAAQNPGIGDDTLDLDMDAFRSGL